MNLVAHHGQWPFANAPHAMTAAQMYYLSGAASEGKRSKAPRLTKEEMRQWMEGN